MRKILQQEEHEMRGLGHDIRPSDRGASMGRPDSITLDLHRFCSGQVLMLGGPLFEGHG